MAGNSDHSETPVIARPRPEDRPKNFSDLLFVPVNDAPDEDPDFRPHWTEEHGTQRRFYVAGTAWFKNNSGLNANNIAQFRDQGVKALNMLSESGEIDWRFIPGMQHDDMRLWQDMSRQQCNAAFNGSPMFLSKALYFLMTCELAIADLIERKGRIPNIQPPTITAPGDIYKVMGIIPACWSVTSFDSRHLDAAIEAEPEFLSKLSRNCGQGASGQFLRELARGATVQYKTAKAVADYCRTHCKDVFGSDAAVISRKIKKLGSKGATELEGVDRG